MRLRDSATPSHIPATCSSNAASGPARDQQLNVRARSFECLLAKRWKWLTIAELACFSLLRYVRLANFICIANETRLGLAALASRTPVCLTVTVVLMFLSVSGPGDSTLARRKTCAHLRVNIDVVYVALASSPAYLSKVGEFE